MLIERINGGWSICELINNHLERRRYFGYTRREAVEAFAAELRAARELDSNPAARQAVERVAEGLASIFATENPRFDRARFLKACGLPA